MQDDAMVLLARYVKLLPKRRKATCVINLSREIAEKGRGGCCCAAVELLETVYRHH
jgi:hypothetical protein